MTHKTKSKRTKTLAGPATDQDQEEHFGPAETAAEQLRRWDAGETIWTIEMGGLGPNYEQAIQVLAIEIVRDNINSPLPDKESYPTWGDSTVERIDHPDTKGGWTCGGFSGAQVGAAKALAYRWLKDGPKKLHESAPKSRHIQCSNFWPHVQS